MLPPPLPPESFAACFGTSVVRTFSCWSACQLLRRFGLWKDWLAGVHWRLDYTKSKSAVQCTRRSAATVKFNSPESGGNRPTALSGHGVTGQLAITHVVSRSECR